MIDYRILPRLSLVVFAARGWTGLNEILSMSERLRSDPLFSSDYDALVDDSELDHPPTGDELRRLAEPRVQPERPDTKLAVIAPADLSYGTSRMHQMMAEGREPHEVMVFRERSEALRWLGREGLGVEKVLDELHQTLGSKVEKVSRG